jgi:RHH-type transcriptional regulator, proline utilization regulon repressor / proline dehydrogenase / delta 1-pyrroline-5-carboxylate dehydrogenase
MPTSARSLHEPSPDPVRPFAALHADIAHAPPALRAAITHACRRSEREAVQWLLAQSEPEPRSTQQARALARELVRAVREKRTRASGVDALMHEFSLSSEEGVALMCLAEALLRIPDHQTADRLIADKISKGDWRRHLGESPSLFVNAATWGLLITGKLVGTSSEQGLGSALTKLIAKGGEPLIRKGVDLAMRMLGNQFVTGQSIEEALENSRQNEQRGYRYSYDMLGEAALTEQDAARYCAAYEHAIHAIGKASAGRGIRNGPGISVKLSALHPRYARAQRARVMNELLPRLKRLVVLARQYNIGLNIDAEEADRLELSLDLLDALSFEPELAGFDGIGFVVQAYQKRAPFVIDYLIDLARRSGRRFMVRLVKGAYWDSEIKRAQVDGMPDYPVYTRKVYTDLCYLVCARKLLLATDAIYSQFATHNAHSLATIYTWARAHGVTEYEFQCLHGMGETLYDQVVGADKLNRACRIYAPVGSHETLLAYLVRRLLENGANSSFVNQIVDENVTIESLVTDPFDEASRLGGSAHPHIGLPHDMFGTERRNSAGMDLNSEAVLGELNHALAEFATRQWQASPLLAEAPQGGPNPLLEVRNPADRRDLVGTVSHAGRDEVAVALQAAEAYAEEWQATLPATRAAMLRQAADLLEQNRPELLALTVREAGKSLPNAVAEVREAVDFLRYYAAQAAQAPPTPALGAVACISPWNFPLAIFVGQVSAALAAGNVVLAKPAEQTPLTAHRAVELLHQAGIPRAALQLLPGRGEVVGTALTGDTRVQGVVFTGSTEVAQLIYRSLAIRGAAEGREIPLIAETGGQNAMIVDSSALPEQVVQDVLVSAFDSAGQRCSALRVLCLQTDIADKTMTMLKGALRELDIGSPDRLSTDVGPVIDEEARQGLMRHIEGIRLQARDFFQLGLPPECAHGSFVAPAIIEIASLDQLQQEVFGPVLHILRYRRDDLPHLIDAINSSGYGLTLGVHSRIDETIDFIVSHAHVGNIYVNRNVIGAVVGVQPFGGEGRSGTGPKAGGPLYIKRLQRRATVERGAHTIHERAASAGMRTSFNLLIAWAGAHGHERLAALAEGYRHASLLDTAMVLPGPTGERNTLAFAPRGTVLCAASSTLALLNQLAAVFATGNAVALAPRCGDLLPTGLPPEIRSAIRLLDAAEAGTAPFQMALADSGQRARILPLLAARQGALVPLVETNDTDSVPLWRLVVERAVCVNTTAAGGNASLMTLGA